MKIENKLTWIGVLLLTALEQGIKLVINYNYLDKTVPILSPVLYFSPVFNRHYSWVNSMLKLGIGKWAHIAVVALLGAFILLFYLYLNFRVGKRKMINVMFAFIFSGVLCSMIDKIFWNGSLDYIQLSGFFTFDLKDVYINVFIGLMILAIVLKDETLKQIDEKGFMTGFFNYILRKP